jgi:signal transduction histidine kinase
VTAAAFDFVAEIRKRPRTWMFVAWTIFGLYYGARNVISAFARGRQIDWSRDFLYELIYWYSWALMMPLIVWLVRRARRRLATGNAVLAIAAAGIVITPVHGALEATLAISFDRFVLGVTPDQIARNLPAIRRAVLLGCFTGYVTYWIIVGLDFAIGYYRGFHERRVAAADLERHLTQARLQNLRAQLHPHFLFNTLNTVSILMMRDLAGARQVLTRLGDLLRLTLQSSDAQEVTVRDEIDYVRRYLDIEQVRFSDRLSVAVDVDPRALDARIPAMILQPLVENSIRHGIAAKSSSGAVAIRIRRANDAVQISVQDDGPGFDGTRAEGVGLSNTRARLSQLYGPAQSLATAAAPGGGALVTITLPYRMLDPEAGLRPAR